MNLEGKTILVTGASSGLGRSTANFLSELGATVILSGRNEERLLSVAESLEDRPHRIAPFDLSATDEIPAWISQIAKDSGPLSGLVHSAGVHDTRPIQFTKSKHIEDLLNVNVTAAMMLAKGFRKKGVHTASSSIVFIASVMAIVGQPAVTAYAASKGAIRSLAMSLALELSREKIRVNCIAPGQVQTEMTDDFANILTEDKLAEIENMHPLGLGRPEDVAGAVAFLIAETGRWITGSMMVVDGGYTIH